MNSPTYGAAPRPPPSRGGCSRDTPRSTRGHRCWPHRAPPHRDDLTASPPTPRPPSSSNPCTPEPSAAPNDGCRCPPAQSPQHSPPGEKLDEPEQPPLEEAPDQPS